VNQYSDGTDDLEEISLTGEYTKLSTAISTTFGLLIQHQIGVICQLNSGSFFQI
jgi:hypothetical protein